jgi:hypothetical protein
METVTREEVWIITNILSVMKNGLTKPVFLKRTGKKQ